MQRLPVIVGFGGVNAAGRSSFHHSYRRMVHEALKEEDLAPMFEGLAKLMGKEEDSDRQAMLDQTLIRKIEPQTFDINSVKTHRKTTMQADGEAIKFQTRKRQLPTELPENWEVEDLGGGTVNVTVKGEMEVMTHDSYTPAVTSAAQLPTGFDPAALYTSRNQPKGLQLAVFGASDAIHSLGMDWETVLEHIGPDEISVYAASAIGQLDDFGGRGLAQAMLKGGRVTSKQMPLMLTQMPADFVNSYMINSVGSTGANIGACATFLYNLRQGVGDIQAGRARVVIVGGAEAPIQPEVIEGFKAMGALAEDAQLAAIDGTEQADNKRACRPFAENAGFTIAEASQFFILMDDELALELGATIYGSVPDVFVNADANKKSISSPGVGNYITVAKAMALAKNILGEEGVKQTFAQAHGTGTPQNRVTESHILNEVAKTFDIEKWPVAAIKSYVGHSLGPAGGDQLTATLGVWEYGFIPSINTISKIADDVYDSNLEFCMEHKAVGDKGNQMKAAILNSKGFGGNNATGLVLSPHTTMEMLEKKYGAETIAKYQTKNQNVKENAKAYDEAVIGGDFKVIYHFGTEVMEGTDLKITKDGIELDKFKNQLKFSTDNPYSEYC
ncbi:beta-ketoacyl synthase [Aliikangiella coralliicola]|uniref:Beta-ketoacyl synthase n=1 Tax=Aliikangiella coralliicola TaxID=2592383 RepID=A0A545U6D5_9GAMM|nr:beta-ketoacyl synthase [Aliikangiella coralliicola]TQV85040.1 beta-ketoacyl synthase [Aliikangiella coralliicola]